LVVSREELYQRLWPTDTFVSFDEGLNTAVRKLRRTLNDSVETPRIIETVPKRGYRFIAKVEFAPPTSVSANRAQNSSKNKSLRNVAFAVSITLSVAAAAFVVTVKLGRKQSPKFSSIAVLPLEQLSGDVGQEYFSDGMTDALITDLAKIKSLRVISRTSAMQFKGKHMPLGQIATQLGVDAVVEGSVTRSGNRVRITAQLIDARQDRHLWAESYEGNLDNILTLQNTVAEAIARQVRVNLSAADRERIKGLPPVDAAAYDEYLRGRYYWSKYTGEGWQKAVQHFQNAIAHDPQYAPAYVGLANCYMLLAAYGYVPPKQSMPAALEAAHKALELDSNLGEAHYTLAFAKTLYQYDWPGADAEFQLAVTLNPNDAIGRMWHSSYLSALGRHSEAIEEQIRARELDPVSLIINTNLCRAYVLAHKPDDAIVACSQALDLDQHFGLAYQWLVTAYEEKHLRDAAFSVEQKAVIVSNNQSYAERSARAYHAGGMRGKLELELGEKRRIYEENHLEATGLASLYARLGRNKEALDYLERAYDAREGWLPFIAVDPSLDTLHSDPHFLALLRRMRLTRKGRP
jgi:TolB-like protein/Tfp pilus assembly protein PilF